MRNNKYDLCARAYLEYYRNDFKKYGWAYDYTEELIRKNPQKSLKFIIELLSLCQTDQEVAYIASGPLEELLHRHLNIVQNEIELYSIQYPLMRVAIRYVWAPEKSEVHNLLSRLHKKLEILSGENIVHLKANDDS